MLFSVGVIIMASLLPVEGSVLTNSTSGAGGAAIGASSEVVQPGIDTLVNYVRTLMRKTFKPENGGLCLFSLGGTESVDEPDGDEPDGGGSECAWQCPHTGRKTKMIFSTGSGTRIVKDFVCETPATKKRCTTGGGKDCMVAAFTLADAVHTLDVGKVHFPTPGTVSSSKQCTLNIKVTDFSTTQEFEMDFDMDRLNCMGGSDAGYESD
ncbi:unnamed protein product [Vitrella brassicaformis CCMP3155]|uniref:Secreted protein n=2 Tax=Vitrella brassicaformis TaxID=1169539 RepID=A0A0G4EQE3_VITBC|nr:unnamed protein product [Vitrella brassicaformis CCMP3155]|eukprot:CEM00015.1 unnamed protein product [Vitrella brassicaformis CCMP3155]